LPLTHHDLRRIVEHTGDSPEAIVRWVDRWGIDMDDEPEGFVILRQGRRVMVLRHERGGCRYLDAENRCSIYADRPLGCRIYPFDPTFFQKGPREGKLRRLKLIHSAECPYELDGSNDVDRLRRLHERYEGALSDYHEVIAEWNSAQRRRKRSGRAAQTAREYFEFLGFGDAFAQGPLERGLAAR
jgi:Fe-S-cluster containining protein